MIYLHKILPVLVSPVFILILLALISLRSNARWPRFLLIALLIISTNSMVAEKAMSMIESDYVPLAATDLEPADTVVVLGGMTTAIEKPDGTITYEFNEAVDRILAGIELIRRDKAKRLILTRGQLPWSAGRPEGEILAEFAESHGIERDQISLTEPVQNTAQEAQSVRTLLDDGESVILVTSAFHMKRAEHLFEAAGVPVIPFPVDFRAGRREFSAMDLLPSADALSDISLVCREMLGRAYYRLRAAL